ncbi:hypothetical protein FQN50_003952 [Emmonsiellopsis sp. PD_5]|nr:hypothetical protein FQN50_003952 [Emmonsiellopsis sp. PD_5]
MKRKAMPFGHVLMPTSYETAVDALWTSILSLYFTVQEGYAIQPCIRAKVEKSPMNTFIDRIEAAITERTPASHKASGRASGDTQQVDTTGVDPEAIPWPLVASGFRFKRGRTHGTDVFYFRSGRTEGVPGISNIHGSEGDHAIRTSRGTRSGYSGVVDRVENRAPPS